MKSLPISRWTFERFGLTPRDLVARLVDHETPKVFCVSLPKAGTHLLERAFCLHPKLYRKFVPTITAENVGRWDGLPGLLSGLRPGQVLMSHLWFESSYPGLLARSGTRGVFIVRDPRDLLVSNAHYVLTQPRHHLYPLFATRSSLRDRIVLGLLGDQDAGYPSLRDRLAAWEGWLGACFVVRFEDLVGPAGGGKGSTQEACVRGLLDYVGASADDPLVKRICSRLYSSKSPTFRQGTAGAWKESFDAELTELVESKCGDLLERYGYGREASHTR